MFFCHIFVFVLRQIAGVSFFGEKRAIHGKYSLFLHRKNTL